MTHELEEEERNFQQMLKTHEAEKAKILKTKLKIINKTHWEKLIKDQELRITNWKNWRKSEPNWEDYNKHAAWAKLEPYIGYQPKTAGIQNKNTIKHAEDALIELKAKLIKSQEDTND